MDQFISFLLVSMFFALLAVVIRHRHALFAFMRLDKSLEASSDAERERRKITLQREIEDSQRELDQLEKEAEERG